MKNLSRKRSLPWLILALITAALAQGILLFPWGNLLNNFYPLSAYTVYTMAGTFVYILAGIFMTLGLRASSDSLPPLDVNTDPPPRTRPRLVFWAISLSLSSVIALYATSAHNDDVRGYFFMGLWILSICLAIFGVLKEINLGSASVESIKGWLKTHRAELFVILLIISAAFFIRMIDLELFPYAFNNDEGSVGSSALCILRGDCKNFFVADWAAQPELAYLAYAISIGIFGKTALAVRLVSVITGTLSVLATYLLAKEMFNKKIAWLAAVLLTTLPIHVHFSRLGVDNIIDSLTTPLMLWMLLRGVKRGSRLSFLAAGILAGLCFYTYPGSLLAPIFGVGALGLFALHTRGFLRAYAESIITLLLVASIITLPILGYYAARPEFFMARMKRDGLFQNGNLEKAMEKNNKSDVVIILQQISLSSFVYIATDAPNNFFNSPKAYLPPLEAILFMFGLAYALWRIKDPRCLILFIWFWTVVILGSALTNNPPANQRLLMSMPALAIMTALGLSKILDAFACLGQPVARFMPLILLGTILAIGTSNLGFYFYNYRMGHYYEDPKDELTYETQVYTQPLHQLGRVFLIANPKALYLGYKSFDFFAPDVEKFELDDVSRQALLNIPWDKDALFIALPGYEDKLKQIVQAIPGGQWREIKRRYQPKYTLFYSYKISKVQLAIFARFANGYEIFRIFPNESQPGP